jgi:hypothetical protein
MDALMNDEEIFRLVWFDLNEKTQHIVYSAPFGQTIEGVLPNPRRNQVLFRLRDYLENGDTKITICVFDLNQEKIVYKQAIEGDLSYVGWHPSGDFFYFTLENESQGIFKVAFFNKDSHFRNISFINGRYRCLGWSDNGNKAIIFNISTSQTYLYNCDTKREQPLMNKECEEAHFVSNDSSLLYVGNESTGIRMENLKTGQLEVIYKSKHWIEHPCLVDGNILIFSDDFQFKCLDISRGIVTLLKVPRAHWDWDYVSAKDELIIEHDGKGHFKENKLKGLF